MTPDAPTEPMGSRPAGGIPFVAAVWCFGYAVGHAWWAVDGAPAFTGGGESFIPGGWVPVVPAALATGVCLLTSLGQRHDWPARVRGLLAGLGAAAGVAMIAYCLLFWISLTMVLMVPFGVSTSGAEFGLFLLRAAGVLGGVLTLCCTRVEFRRVRSACERCGRRRGRAPERRTDPSPWWAYAGAHLAVAGLVARLGPLAPQLRTGQGSFDGPGGVGFKIFVGLMILAGTLLPLALAHRWGRIWPAWVLPWAGRHVPRWVVLGPGVFMGAGLSLYFGVGGMSAVATTGNNTPAQWDTLTEIGGYTVWGAGLLVASASYYRLTKPECRRSARAATRPSEFMRCGGVT